jgi:hypothetical protein
MADASGKLIVLHVHWTDGGTARQETYGPWTAADDESHLEQIFSFMRAWPRVTGCEPSSVTMAIVTDPQPFISIPESWTPEQIAESWTPEQIAEFQERWDAIHRPGP